MKKKFILGVVMVGILGAGAFLYFRQNKEDSSKESEEIEITEITEENVEEELKKTEEELEAKIEELDEAAAALANAEVDEFEQSEDVVITDEIVYEEEYINELEQELDSYYALYEDVYILIDEIDQLISEYNQILATTEAFYDEVSGELQGIIDGADYYADEALQKMQEAKNISDQAKLQYESLNELTNSRQEVFASKLDDGIKDRAGAYIDYFDALRTELPTLQESSSNNFTKNFINKYYSQMPDYLALDGLASTLSLYSGSFQVPQFNPSDFSIQKPDLLR